MIDIERNGMVTYSKNNWKGVLAMPRTEALIRAQEKYQKKLKQMKIWLDPATDAEIIERLDRVPNKAEYIKFLIKKDIESGR